MGRYIDIYFLKSFKHVHIGFSGSCMVTSDHLPASPNAYLLLDFCFILSLLLSSLFLLLIFQLGYDVILISTKKNISNKYQVKRIFQIYSNSHFIESTYLRSQPCSQSWSWSRPASPPACPLLGLLQPELESASFVSFVWITTFVWSEADCVKFCIICLICWLQQELFM